MAKGAICFGLPPDRADALAGFVDEHDLPVSIWPDVDVFNAGGLSVFTEAVRRQVALVILNRSYQRGTAIPEPIQGAGLTLEEQIEAIQDLFPSARIVYVTDRLLTLTREFAGLELELPDVTSTAYAFVDSAGQEGLKRAFETFLR